MMGFVLFSLFLPPSSAVRFTAVIGQYAHALGDKLLRDTSKSRVVVPVVKGLIINLNRFNHHIILTTQQ